MQESRSKVCLQQIEGVAMEGITASVVKHTNTKCLD